ncbi:MAG: homoserine kinase [Pseudomonadota bacterium]
MSHRAEAFAPASIGNVGVGFDVLGLAIEGAGDTVICERSDAPGVTISSITGDDIAGDVSKIPFQADSNTAAISADAFWRECGDGGGLILSLHKGTPLASGMGSSAASAVAAVVAANGLLENPLPFSELLPFAMRGEAFASGAEHADNVAPSLFGGLVLCPPTGLPTVYSLPVPAGLSSVLVHPRLHVETAAARQALSDEVRLKDAVAQTGRLATVVRAAYENDAETFAANIVDVLVEPQRKNLVAGFDEVKAAAEQAGALACSLSGSGPSLFAIARQSDATAVADAMVDAFGAILVSANAWCSPLNTAGAVLRATS